MLSYSNIVYYNIIHYVTLGKRFLARSRHLGSRPGLPAASSDALSNGFLRRISQRYGQSPC